jgi:hypothetical protein
MPDDLVGDTVTESDLRRLAILRVVLMANALNEARRSILLADLSTDELVVLCRPILEKLRDMCDAALEDECEAPIN